MAELLGGTTIGGYPVIHTGMSNVMLSGKITLNNAVPASRGIISTDGTTIHLFKSNEVSYLNLNTGNITFGSGAVRLSGGYDGTFFAEAKTSDGAAYVRIKAKDFILEDGSSLKDTVSSGKELIASAITDKGQGQFLGQARDFTSLSNAILAIEVGDYAIGDTIPSTNLSKVFEMETINVANHTNSHVMPYKDVFWVVKKSVPSYIYKYNANGSLIFSYLLSSTGHTIDLVDHFDVDSSGRPFIVFTKSGTAAKYIMILNANNGTFYSIVGYTDSYSLKSCYYMESTNRFYLGFDGGNVREYNMTSGTLYTNWSTVGCDNLTGDRLNNVYFRYGYVSTDTLQYKTKKAPLANLYTNSVIYSHANPSQGIAVSDDGAYVYISTAPDYQLHKYDGNTGQLLASVPHGQSITQFHNFEINAEGDIYSVDGNELVCCFDKDLNLKWSYSATAVGNFNSLVYHRSDGKLYGGGFSVHYMLGNENARKLI